MAETGQLNLLGTDITETRPVLFPALANTLQTSPSALPVIDVAMKRIFSDELQNQQQRARQTMGAALEMISDEEVEVYTTELNHLIDYWLNMFERDIFNGQTLHELLG